MSYLEVHSLKKNFGGIIALSDGSLSCEKGRICGLLGANGSGKSTFSKILAGLIKSNGGEIFIDGSKVEILSPKQAKQNGVAIVHQNLSLIPELTVWENINLGTETDSPIGWLDNKKSQKKAKDMIERLCPELSINEKIINLSPAHKQLVEIAKAFCRPNIQIMIMDEPTASLEMHQCERVFEEIKKLKEQNITIIFISHRLWEVLRICDTVVVFRNGCTVATLDYEKEEKDENKIISLITGEQWESAFHIDKVDKSENDVLLETRGLALKSAYQNIDFKLLKGEILGLGGLQGQGQNELLYTLAGLIQAEQGDIILNGEKMNPGHPANAIEKGVVLVPGDRQKEGLFFEHSVNFNLMYPKVTTKGKSPYLFMRQENALNKPLINGISLHPSDGRNSITNLSGGNQQKVVVGKWLNLVSQVMLLNDPTKGVDIGAKSEIYQLIVELSQKGIGILIFSSDYSELISICDRVLIMFEGDIVDNINHQDFSEEKLISSSLRANLTEIES